jgi:sugar lactone lactonase YvrE
MNHNKKTFKAFGIQIILGLTTLNLATASHALTATETSPQLVRLINNPTWNFSIIHSIATDKLGNVYVSDNDNHKIYKFDSNGHFLLRWGSFGKYGKGHFSKPAAIAVDDDNNVYVTDYSHVCIQKFDSNGKFLTQWGSWGTQDGQCAQTSGLAVDHNGNVYLADYWRDPNQIAPFTPTVRIQKFDKQGKFLTKWGSFGNNAGQFGYQSAEHLAIDSNNNLYAIDQFSNHVQKFDNQGKLLAEFTGGDGITTPKIEKPSALAIDRNNNFYISSTTQSAILKFSADGSYLSRIDNIKQPQALAIGIQNTLYSNSLYEGFIKQYKNTGKFIKQWGKPIGTTNFFQGAKNIAQDSNHNNYILTDGNKIKVFNSDGLYLKQIDLSPYQDFRSFNNLAIDQNGYLYINKYPENEIIKLDTNGKLITSWTVPIDKITDPLNTIKKIVFHNNQLYVLDAYKQEMRVYDTNGKFLWNWTSTAITNNIHYNFIQDFTFDQNNNVYLINNTNVYVTDPTGKVLKTWGNNGTANGQLYSPYFIDVDSQHNVYIVDLDNSRIQKFTADGKFLSSWHNSIGTIADLLIDNSDTIYALDGTNKRIAVFSYAPASSNKSQMFSDDIGNDVN